MKKEFVVIGLGRFGGSIVKELVSLGANVMAIDTLRERVDEYASIATQAVVADTTDEAVIKSLGLWNFEHIIVAIGEDIQASILTTLILKEHGVPQITVKAQNDYHEKVLRKIGADFVVHPERDMGIRIANNMMSTNVLDYLELSDEYSIMEIKASDKIAGHSLIDLDIRAQYGINIVGIKRGATIIVSPVPQDPILLGDILLVIGADVDINRFVKKAL
ncbi:MULTISPECIES: TrkA family potassium uptake protein [Bacillales]|uniref:TrkA family potassium uptake protein n=1 Tax=Lysinibacillus louembei TaxID=1470088 RepID=A0ABZ0RVA0_9BACI|nr:MULTISPECIES: TrkA family potassium uptake protein [Bacillales]MCT6924182.1 TrkA family potassium uptake protein [Metasolibacillus sp.]MCT6940289.1 TrkA family potassium uptake protein [Metasolibacillus sp.]WPK12159.1 TrkA family potassium uptake protein [Lysinibacillus louembei]